VLQGNEYFQRKSYLTALREYNVSVLSAPSADDSAASMRQHSAAERDNLADGKPQSQDKTVDEDVENKRPETEAKDETTSDVEQKSTGDDVQESKEKDINKNELALAYANRLLILCNVII